VQHGKMKPVPIPDDARAVLKNLLISN